MYQHKRVPKETLQKHIDYGWKLVAEIKGLFLITRKNPISHTVYPKSRFTYLQDFPVNSAQL